ncbi:MAG: glycosyltransferase, partial [Tateyamaria sp.]
MMRVAIVVTHLLGTGHLARALTLGHAFAAADHTVMVVSGGAPVAHLDSSGVSLVQLPSLRSNGTDFTNLLTPDNAPADADYLTERQRQLVDQVIGFAPDVVITELFPFGRRNLRAEFEALLTALAGMTPKPVVLSSIRDILAPPSKPAKIAFADQMVADHYDAVLVHSDPDLVPLTTSWPVSDAL